MSSTETAATSMHTMNGLQANDIPVWERSSDRTATRTAAQADPRTTAKDVNPLVELYAKIFLGAQAARVVAITACHEGEGASHISRALGDLLNDEVGMPAVVMSAEKYLSYFSNLPSYSRNQGHKTNADLEDKVILIDCPPLLASATAMSALAQADGALLVVKDGSRSKAEIQRAIATVNAAQGRVLGVVLNMKREIVPRWITRFFR